MEVALFRTDTLLLDDRLSVGMKECAGPLRSYSRTWRFFTKSVSCFYFMLISSLSIY
jgi:hypothetical protein